MPVGQRTVGLETGDDPDPEIGLPRGGADARRDDAGCQPRQIAEESPPSEAAIMQRRHSHDPATRLRARPRSAGDWRKPYREPG